MSHSVRDHCIHGVSIAQYWMEKGLYLDKE